MSQTSYTVEAPEAFPGMLADSSPNRIVSRANEDVPLDFGKPVVAGTDPEVQVLLPSAADEDFQGVTIHRHNEKTRVSGDAKTETDENVDVGREVYVFVQVEVTVVAGEAVAYRHTDNGPLLAGGWTNVTDAETQDISAFARWDKGASADGIALLVLNMP